MSLPRQYVFKIIGQDNDLTNQGYKEATAIKMLKLDLNVDEERCYIPPLYNNLFQIKYLYIRRQSACQICNETHEFRKYRPQMKTAGLLSKASKSASKQIMIPFQFLQFTKN